MKKEIAPKKEGALKKVNSFKEDTLKDIDEDDVDLLL
jgi:hypothetical protein